LRKVNLDHADLGHANLDGVAGYAVFFDWGLLGNSSLVRARIDQASFINAHLYDAKALEAVLHWTSATPIWSGLIFRMLI
jgi:uncharacterized protein YjbI with pentapeptide repeats